MLVLPVVDGNKDDNDDREQYDKARQSDAATTFAAAAGLAELLENLLVSLGWLRGLLSGWLAAALALRT
ncbi:MAG: hypothetical protein U0514_00760 [Candidatus Andersenbacteria bacterium]